MYFVTKGCYKNVNNSQFHWNMEGYGQQFSFVFWGAFHNEYHIYTLKHKHYHTIADDKVSKLPVIWASKFLAYTDI